MARWFTLAGSKSGGPGRGWQAGTTARITRALTSSAEASYRKSNLGATSSPRMEAMCSNLAGKLSDSAVFLRASVRALWYRRRDPYTLDCYRFQHQ